MNEQSKPPDDGRSVSARHARDLAKLSNNAALRYILESLHLVWFDGFLFGDALLEVAKNNGKHETEIRYKMDTVCSVGELDKLLGASDIGGLESALIARYDEAIENATIREFFHELKKHDRTNELPLEFQRVLQTKRYEIANLKWRISHGEYM